MLITKENLKNSFIEWSGIKETYRICFTLIPHTEQFYFVYLVTKGLFLYCKRLYLKDEFL